MKFCLVCGIKLKAEGCYCPKDIPVYIQKENYRYKNV